MTIHFTRSAGNQYLSAPDSAALTYPNGDWTLAWVMVFDGELVNSNTQYFISNGSYGSGGSLNVLYYPTNADTSGLSARRNEVCISLGNNTVPDAPDLYSGKYTTQGQARLFVVTRNGTSFTLRSAPILSAAPTDGSAVVTEMAASWNPSYTTLDGSSGMVIGGRADLNTSRLADQSLARIFRFDGALSDLEVAQLAYGKEITDLGHVPAWYVRGNDAADYADQTHNNTFTASGSISNGTAPGFGYASSGNNGGTSAATITGNPTISSPVQVGTPVTVTAAATTGTTTTFQWLLDGAVISGATSASYTPQASDQGHALSVKQTSSTSTAPAATATSSAATVAAAPASGTAATFTSNPSISGTPTVGVAIGYTSGTITGSTPTVTQQWLLDGVAISGATGSTYTPVAGDAGHTLTVRQSAANAYGPTATATSAGAVVQSAPVASAVDVADVTANRIFQRAANVATVPLSGTYAGATPSSIEYQLYAANGSTVLQAWTALSATISGGTWSATPSVPQGGMYRLVTRSKDAGGAVLATSAIKSNLWGVGDLFACVGSSSPAKWFDGSSANGATPAANVRVYNLNGSSAWSTISTDCCGVIMANTLAAAASLPVGMLAYGVGGDTLTGNWTNTSASSWTNFVAGVGAVGGKLAGVFVSVGSNDAANGWLQSRASHLANLRTLVANIRSTTGQSALPMLLSGFNRRPGVATNQANWCRMAENDIGNDANVYSVQILDFELSGDNIHLTPAGFAACANRITPVFARALYGDGSYLRGPKIAGYSASAGTITVALTHRNGSDIRKVLGDNGWTTSDASGALTIASIRRIDNMHIALVCNRAIVPPFQLQYLSGPAPDVSGQTFDNGALVLPVSVETDLAQHGFSATLYSDAGKTVPAANLANINVQVYEPGSGLAPIYESTSATTDANGVLSGYATTAFAAGTIGRIVIRTSDNRYYTGPVTFA